MSSTNLTVVGWAIVLFVLYLWSKTKMGDHIIYYGLILIGLFLVINNYQRLNAVMYGTSS